MKFKYTFCYPLSLAVAAMSILVANAQNAEEAPVQAVEEKSQKEPADTGKASDVVNREVEEAMLRLEAAKRSVDAATGDEKARALADVEDAEKQLIAAQGRGESIITKDNPGRGKDKSDSGDRGKNPDKKPETAKVPKEVKEKMEKVDEDVNPGEEAHIDPEMKSEENPGENVTPGPGKDEEPVGRNDKKKDQPAAEEVQIPTAPEVSQTEPKMEPETPTEAAVKPEAEMKPEAEVKPEVVVETKEEVKEAKEADQAVDQTTLQVEEEADRKKLNLKDKGDARDLIRDLIGRESEVSKAEAARETRLEPRFQGNGRGENRDEIQAASDFLLRQLSGNAKLEEAPAFFRRPAEIDPRLNRREDRLERRNAPPLFREQAPPRYYHEGRRYVRFDSRNSIPAILLAAAALDRVLVQPANRTDDYFREDQGPDYYANELPPENFRGNDAVVVSYPVSTSSMISSNDIIFAQGSTRFADGHSYDMVMALADAMANPALKDARFVVEGHASAEGSYEDNMALSQRRAEAIVRDMVREGIDPERLIPVGYGESEARYPADSAERLRSQDRNVRVFRTGVE